MFSKRDEKEYERRFNNYIFRVIKNEYVRFKKSERKRIEELTLNEYTNDDIEKIDYLRGDTDINIQTLFTPSELELVCADERIYSAIKPLTYNEKFTVFLCVILDKSYTQVAKILGYKSVSSVTRLLDKALNKIRSNLANERRNK